MSRSPMRSRFNRRLDMQERFIKARRRSLVDAKPGLHDCLFILDGLKPDFNIGKIFRSADAFGISELHLTGVEYFDPEPAKGSLRWVPFFQHQDFASCYQSLQKKEYTFFALEPCSDAVVGHTVLPEKSAFIMGHEEFGISFDLADYPQFKRLSVPQWGHVQSLNVSIAASIVMFEYVRQHGKSLSSGRPQIPCSVTRRGPAGNR